MKRSLRLSRLHGRTIAARGFTLVELMVAMTGGLFVSVIVFTLARDGSRFYQRESRVASATLAAVAGFDRLRTDIARAGFLSSPNVRQDPFLCGQPTADPSWPEGLAHLASVRITQGGSPENITLKANNITPDRIELAGSYSSLDAFPINTVEDDGARYHVYLQSATGPLARLGYATNSDQVALLSSVFGEGRALRIVDDAGSQYFGTIESVAAGAQAEIVLARTPLLTYRTSAGDLCGLRANSVGALANVVNLIRYDIRNLDTTANTAAGKTAYAPLYGAAAPYDADRSELVRVELDTAGTPIEGTEELVAEYAVDLKFGLTVATDILNNSDPTLTSFAPGAAEVANWAGDTTGLGPGQGPQRIRAVRVRLSTRSREGDRDTNINTTLVPNVAAGLYRVGLGTAAGAPFARVRTVQSDVALHNQMGETW